MSGWEPKPVRVRFDLDAQSARQALRDALHDRRPGRGRRDWSFQGEVLHHRVRVFARWGFGRAELPELTGAVTSEGSGSRFVGAIALPRWARWTRGSAWAVLTADLVFLGYLLWVVVIGDGSVPHVLAPAVAPAIVAPFAAVLSFVRAGRVRRHAEPPTAAQALQQWLERTANNRRST